MLNIYIICFQLVESEFDKIEREVKNEVQKRFSKLKSKNESDIRTSNLLQKAQDFRKKEVKRKLLLTTTENKTTSFPAEGNVPRSVSFKDHIEREKGNAKDITEFKFEVLESKQNDLKSSQRILHESNTRNVGVSEVRSIDVKRREAPVLSSHVLPSINIRSTLHYTWIFGLIIIFVGLHL